MSRLTTAARREYDALVRQYAPNYPPTVMFSGTNPKRGCVGKPGHCEYCAVLGHVKAHPSLGCGDVGCNLAHGEDEEKQ
jgi:hypothetical protein